MYIVLNTNSGNDQLIPVPLSIFGWDSNTQAFALNADATMLQNAPTFPSDQFPDTTVSGWNSQFDAFWQNNGSGGSGNRRTGNDYSLVQTNFKNETAKICADHGLRRFLLGMRGLFEAYLRFRLKP